jgi:ribosomal protein L16 Arg81 hydroxylase
MEEQRNSQVNAFEWLLNPIRPIDFLNNYFEKEPLLIERNRPDYYNELMSAYDIENVMDLGENIANFDISQSTGDDGLGDSAYSTIFKKDNISIKAGIRKRDVARRFNEQSSSLLVSQVQNVIPKLRRFVNHLSLALDGKCYADLFITPPSISNGFGIHFDLNDVYILQLFGSKRWNVFETYNYLPDNPSFYRGFSRNEGDHRKLFCVDLKPGNFLYLPRGYVHDVTTTDQISMHVTIGCLNQKWSDTFRLRMTDLFSRVECFRRRIPDQQDQAAEELTKIKELFRKEMTSGASESRSAKCQEEPSLVKTQPSLLDILNTYK